MSEYKDSGSEVEELREELNRCVRLVNILEGQVSLMSRIAACAWLAVQGPIMDPMPKELKIPDGDPVIFVPGPMVKANRIITSGKLPLPPPNGMRIVPP